MSLFIRAASAIHRTTRLIVEDFLRISGIAGKDRNDFTPSFAVVGPAVSGKSPTANSDLSVWDGFLYAGGLGGCPKHKIGFERRRVKRRDMRRFHPFIKSWHMLVPCDSCGGLRKKHHLCETCYDQTRYETQQVREKLKDAGLDLSQETVLKYKDDNGRYKFNTNKQIFAIDRKRPSGWFNDAFWGR